MVVARMTVPGNKYNLCCSRTACDDRNVSEICHFRQQQPSQCWWSMFHSLIKQRFPINVTDSCQLKVGLTITEAYLQQLTVSHYRRREEEGRGGKRREEEGRGGKRTEVTKETNQ